MSRLKREYVYFLRVKGGGPIKIGRSGDPWERLSSFQTAHWLGLELIGVIGPGRASGIEARLHQEFEADRIRGEWFKSSDRLWQRICDLCDSSDADLERAS